MTSFAFMGLGYGGDLSAPCRPAIFALRAILTRQPMLTPILERDNAPYRLGFKGLGGSLISAPGQCEAALVALSDATPPHSNTGGKKCITLILWVLAWLLALGVLTVCAMHVWFMCNAQNRG